MPRESIIICLPPGASSATPGRSRSPSSASLTVIRQSLSRRSAKALVKAAGMCWISSSGAGKLAGNWVRTRCKATGPPVEVPMATSRYGLRFGAAEAAGAGIADTGTAWRAVLAAGAEAGAEALAEDEA